MILGINPLAIGARPPKFAPYLDARCLAVWDAAAPQTVVSTLTTVAPSLRNGADALIVPSGNTGPTIVSGGSGIAGNPAWRFDGVLKALNCPGFAFPAFGGGASVFWVVVARGMGSLTGFNNLVSAGGASSPYTFLQSGGAGISGFSGATTLTATTGYAQGTAKRLVQKMSGAAGDYIQWGSAGAPVTGTFGGQAAQSGFSLAVRGDLLSTSGVTHGQVDIAWVGVFSGDPATGGFMAKIDAWLAARFTGLAT